MANAWDAELAQFLSDLSAVQDETLAVLSEKRAMLLARNAEGLVTLAERERSLVERLQESLRKREELLARAQSEGLPSGSLKSLARALPRAQREQVEPHIKEASAKARLLQNQSLTNWVVVQRTLLHLSQLLEIIATGGRLRPTYDTGSLATSSGSLVDQAI